MTHRIFRSILIAVTTVMLLVLAVIFGVMYEYSSGIQKKQLSDELDFAAAAVGMDGREYLASVGHSENRLTWIASDGTVIYDTKGDSESMENHSDREEFKEAILNGHGESSRYSATFTETTDYIARRLDDGTVLRISSSRASVLTLALGMLHPMIVIFVLAFILSAFLANGMSKRIVGPLGKIDLDHPLDGDAYEELAPFLARINRQNHKINEQLYELRRRTDEFDQITGSMNEGLVLLNDRGTVLSINPAARGIFGCGDCCGQDFLTIDRGRDMSEAVGKAMRDGKATTENEKDGRVIRYDINRIESDKKVIGAVILAFDVTDSALAERNRREFTANVSHELKTPLQTIIGSAELIENGFVAGGYAAVHRSHKARGGKACHAHRGYYQALTARRGS
ncbi:MAG: histidine kinase dimerization/phospho-acceptor domain-containing protein [Eubacteriales bacterium]